MTGPARPGTEAEAELSPWRAQVNWVCETLIPADPAGASLSAVEAAVPGEFLPRALAVRPDLCGPITAILSALPEFAPDQPLAVLKALPAADFDLLAFVVAGAYFLNPRVSESLGYPGQQALHGRTDYDEIADAVERVQQRGPRYVQP